MGVNDNQNFITKQEHDETYRVKKVFNYVMNSDGNLSRQQANEIVSSVNSSATPINTGSNFTGEWEDTNGFSSAAAGNSSK